MFGFSLGGFTSLVEIGGTPELARMALLCSTSPSAPECAFIKQRHGDQLEPNPPKPVWVHDARIKAAVVAAPAVSFLFGPGDLRQVSIPVQLWRAENDTQCSRPMEQCSRSQGASKASRGTHCAGSRSLCLPCSLQPGICCCGSKYLSRRPWFRSSGIPSRFQSVGG